MKTPAIRHLTATLLPWNASLLSLSSRLLPTLLLPTLLLTLAACSPRGTLTPAEKALITGQDSLLYVLTIKDSTELAVLREQSIDFSEADLQSPEFQELVAKMKYTVTDPSQDGVGIAAPQIGLNRRLVVVCRMDLPGEPFIAYANPRIVSLWGDTLGGREGCLSIPGLRGDVPRSQFAAIQYVNLQTLEIQVDTVETYVARIFQHEIDHLDGILYTDRTDNLWPVED